MDWSYGVKSSARFQWRYTNVDHIRLVGRYDLAHHDLVLGALDRLHVDLSRCRVTLITFMGDSEEELLFLSWAGKRKCARGPWAALCEFDVKT